MTPVEKAVRQLIALDGPQTVERVMGLANGYYYASRDPFGTDGDFITAPEISQMFGEMLGLWLLSVWQSAGQPSSVQLVELGPGRGTLMADALRIASRLSPAFLQAVTVHLVETSPVLQKLQAERLSASSCPIQWHTHAEEIPNGFTLLIANEFFDALPVRQFIRQHDGWHEKCVIEQDGTLVFGINRALSPESIVPHSFHSSPPDSYAEFSPASHDVLRTLSTRIADQGGAALIIDYGHIHSQNGETLQALHKHRSVPVLDHLGEADLTAHVDFEALATIAQENGCTVPDVLTQSVFLLNMGIAARAQQLMANATPEQQSALMAAFQRLTDISSPTSMGALFKVMCIHHLDLAAVTGFSQ